MILLALEENSNTSRGQNNSTQLQQLQLCLFTSVMGLETPYHLSVAHEDMEKSMNYCRIFTELAETFLETMVTGCVGGRQHYAIKILDFVLTCVGHHDYEVKLLYYDQIYYLKNIFIGNNDKII